MFVSISRPQMRGFTIVELLVATAIIGVLVALLLPAIEASREAARRTSCSNNLRTLALAAHAWHDTFGTLPCNLDDEVATTAARRDYSFVAQMLCFLERQSLYDEIDLGNPNPANLLTFHDYVPRLAERPETRAAGVDYTRIQELKMRLVRCPSDLSPAACVSGGSGYQYSSYAGVSGGAFGAPGVVDPPPRPQPESVSSYNEGIFPRAAGRRITAAEPHEYTPANVLGLDEITDGASHTLMLGEYVTKDRQAKCWIDGKRMYATTGLPLNFDIHVDRKTPVTASVYQHGFMSSHLSGAQFAVADGSVVFVNERIHPLVYSYLGSHNGGEPVLIPEK